MANLKNIISKNNKTFYDYQTEKVQSIAPRLAFTGAVSVLLAVMFSAIDDSFVNAVLTVQSILVGFSFSVLFFLLSGAEIKSVTEGSIEQKQKVKKLKTLSEELFYNVSYYNLVAISSVLVALLYLLPDMDRSSKIPTMVLKLVTSMAGSQDVLSWFSSIGTWVEVAVRFILYFLVIEGMYTFWRTVRRVSFFFAEKLSLGAEPSADV
ncbi:MAG TPA: hypothetical protein DD827_00380 [Gammaproteobacteria bacterium]|jgi:uncharacterized membrane protein|nr:hypothetical protein [Gammaproteobacteria bacterium]